MLTHRCHFSYSNLQHIITTIVFCPKHTSWRCGLHVTLIVGIGRAIILWSNVCTFSLHLYAVSSCCTCFEIHLMTLCMEGSTPCLSLWRLVLLFYLVLLLLLLYQHWSVLVCHRWPCRDLWGCGLWVNIKYKLHQPVLSGHWSLAPATCL